VNGLNEVIEGVKMKTYRFIFLTVIIWFLLSGCSQNSISSGTERSIPDITSTPIPTATEDKLKSRFTTPTLVFETATVTPTPNSTPTLAATEVRPTLTISDSLTNILSLMENNGDCELPCVWGIEPGKTKLDDARQYFEHLGWKGSISPNMPQGPVYDTLAFDAGGPEFFRLVKYLSPQNIIVNLAEPDRVWINLATNLEIIYPEITEFGIYFYYKTPNILLHYIGSAKKHGASYRICPKNPFLESVDYGPNEGNVSIYTANSAEVRSPESLIEPFGKFGGMYTVDEALGISPEEFYKQLIETKDPVCFDTPLSVWAK
jgi:hypothetical protein